MKIETLKVLLLGVIKHHSIKKNAKKDILDLIDLYEQDCDGKFDFPQITPWWGINSDGTQGEGKVPYSTICSCNPANGGSGVCGCIMGNQMVDPPAPIKYSDANTFNTATDQSPTTTQKNVPYTETLNNGE